MAITIHYKGKIKDITQRDAMTEELEDICKSLGWKYDTIKRGTETCLSYQYTDEHDAQGEKVDIKFSGIVFTPPGSETVVMVISNGGWIVNPLALSHFGNDASNEFKEFAYSQFVKTQFAGPEIHIALIKLFKYLSAKYFDFFEVRDEADYWETMDKDILLGKFKYMDNLLNKVESWLNSEIFSDANNLEDIVDKIEKLPLRGRGGGGGKGERGNG
ncbi:MAG: hypothetical protein IPI60_01160 [Saprospiraceae bacterium]|nr:hypothetical protein [Saprospiraceae bacterium]